MSEKSDITGKAKYFSAAQQVRDKLKHPKINRSKGMTYLYICFDECWESIIRVENERKKGSDNTKNMQT